MTAGRRVERAFALLGLAVVAWVAWSWLVQQTGAIDVLRAD